MQAKKLIGFCFCTAFFLCTAACGPSFKAESILSSTSDTGFASVPSKPISNAETVNKMKQKEPFIDLKMVTNRLGYAITKRFHVIKTSDGGESWTEILKINSALEYSDEPALFAYDDKTVSIAFYTDSGIEVKKSIDGGKNWSISSIKMQTDSADSGYGGSLNLSFVDQSDGFLLTSGMPAAGLMGKALYKTSDGGNSWIYIGRSQNPDQEAVNLKGINGYTTGMAFFHSDVGYITCTYHGQKELSVYKTVDGGKSWPAAGIPVPEKYASLTYGKDYYADAYSPAVYGKDHKNAKMELDFRRNGECSVYLYSSDDGGTTWRIDGRSNLLMRKTCFVDSKNGFGLDRSGILYTSHDGGLTWIGIS